MVNRRLRLRLGGQRNMAVAQAKIHSVAGTSVRVAPEFNLHRAEVSLSVEPADKWQ